MTLYEELKWRGLIQDITSPDLVDKLNNGGLKFYIGTDPTADSLHLGHYSSFLIVRRLANAGHTPLILVGVATGLIGDPRGTTERDLSMYDEIESNFQKLKIQLQELFPYEVVNNYDWVKDITIIDFFRNYGKYINVNYMISKDLVKRQMETGISYAEFSYMLIQGLDFKYLYENRGVELQVAGSDQWGNITTGIELIRKTTGKEVYAFTMPLITDSKGVKFGKSEGEAIWINKEKTSSYELYQFLINTEDSKVVEYLKRLTFLSKDEIEEIEKEHLSACHLRLAQKVLAEKIVTDLHGEEEYNNAVLISKRLFEGNIKELSLKDILVGFKNVPHFRFIGGKLIEVLVNAKICSSKREAREFISNGSISINGSIIKDLDFNLDINSTIEQKIVVIRRGKKKYYLGYFEN